jgi:RimJ/RimL family protein N-acetyltransferase
LLADIFAGLSPHSRFARFLAPKGRLTAAELRYVTDVDHHDHEALIAITRLGGEPVGVVRFIRDLSNPTSAEFAAEVVDAWQNRGVGSLLATRIAARARQEDISELTALMSASNHRSARLIAKAGGVNHRTRDGGTVSYRVALPPPRHRAWSTPRVALVPLTRDARRKALRAPARHRPGRPRRLWFVDACARLGRLLSMVQGHPLRLSRSEVGLTPSRTVCA